jgi:ferredoxin-thioredoxin reductase catalytic chain
MMTRNQIQQQAERDAQTHGYALNPNPAILHPLLEGLQQNAARYGYPSCPCRMAAGIFELDRDILCPCDYRDPDVLEHGYCYCALYVRRDMIDTPPDAFTPIPERRPEAKQTRASGVPLDTPAGTQATPRIDVTRKLWYCKQCGYTVFREDPPFICPICQAKRERFAEIRLKTEPTSERAS